MTDNTDSATTARSRLTLKLPTSAQSKPVTTKTTENTKVGSSSLVQVTIKGRRKDAPQSAPEVKSKAASKMELEARIQSISESKSSLNDIKTHEILGKALRDERDSELKRNEEKAREQATEQDPEPLEKEDLQSKSDLSNPPAASPNPSYNSDSFDVRNKIKNSIAITNREKEERDKLVSERKKIEQARLEKERADKLSLEADKVDKKKPKKLIGDFSKKVEEEAELKKSKFTPQDKLSTRKLTYIVGGDDDSDSSSWHKRKKQKSRIYKQDSSQKEYKKIAKEVGIPELIIVSELADRMAEKTGDVVKKLFSMGVVVTSNQAIDVDTAEIIVAEFGHIAKRISHSDVENVLSDEEDSTFEKLPRAPVVTIMGHVDHGKTSLLDALRQTDVVSGEHGGITQHIGASRIKVRDDKFITFLDTPGHEAFTEMRSRGANVTDIVILVVAADDGVKEQTVEAISHAKAANVPIIVAVNKIDKPGADAQRVKNELLSHHIVAEDLGGDVIFVQVSAKQKLGLDKLEEAILLQAEMLDLRSVYEGKSSGTVLESRIDPAKGVIATLLVQQGTLDVSDIIVVGTSYGRVRKMSDDNGKNIKSATPSFSVEVLGLDGAPNAGDKFVEVTEERQAREIISYRLRKEKEAKTLKNSAKSITEIFRESGKNAIKQLNVIIKSDVHGSAEAISSSVTKLNSDEVAVKVIHMATGGITESDVNLAAASSAIVLGFNARANPQAKELARVKGVDIRYYSIIYNLVDDLKLILSGMLSPIKSEEYLGQAEIRQVFKVSGSGKIAGSFVTDGLLRRNAKVRLLRDNVVIHDGVLKTLKRFKDDVKEVKSGFECGIAFENYEDIKEKDMLECYEIVEQKRSI